MELEVVMVKKFNLNLEIKFIISMEELSIEV